MEIKKRVDMILDDIEKKLNQAITEKLGEGWTGEDLKGRDLKCLIQPHTGLEVVRHFYMDGELLLAYEIN